MEAAARSSAGNRTRRLAGYVLYTVYLLAVVEISCRLLLSIPFIASRTAGTDFAWRRAWVRSQPGAANKYGFDVYDPTKGWISKPNLRKLRVFVRPISDAFFLHARGKSIPEAAVEAARLRFRPILMTSFAFILGVYPLVVASGAGAASRRALGTAVFGGMLTSTFLAVLFVPVFYVISQSASERWAARRANPAPSIRRTDR